MAIYTTSNREVPANACITVFENFPGMNLSQWCVAVYYPAAAYDSPYEPIIWLPKSGVSSHPQFAAQHAEVHRRNKTLAEIIAKAIRVELGQVTENA
jgi:hypothetical protein